MERPQNTRNINQEEINLGVNQSIFNTALQRPNSERKNSSSNNDGNFKQPTLLFRQNSCGRLIKIIGLQFDNTIPVIPQDQKSPKVEVNYEIPKITILEVIIELICLFIFIFTVIYFVLQFLKLPPDIPIQHPIDSKIDNMGVQQNTVQRDNFIALIIMDALIYILISLVEIFTHKFKYIVEITPDNSQSIFINTRIFIIFVKLISLSMILYACIALFHIARNEWSYQTMYFLALFMIPYILAGGIYYRVLRSFQQ